MRIPIRHRETGPRFTVTPLVDICFNLIVFFGLASLFTQNGNSDSVALPKATQGKDARSDETQPLIVTVDAQRKLAVSGALITSDGFEKLLADRAANHVGPTSIRIRADKTVPYGDVKPLILACARYGIINLEFAVSQN